MLLTTCLGHTDSIISKVLCGIDIALHCMDCGGGGATTLTMAFFSHTYLP